jgi:23S rRNA pseudouridine1911/1915/1917 synthase
MLHAWRLGLAHPVSGRRLELTQPVPRDFWRLALLLNREVQKVGVTGSVGCGKSTVADLLGYGRHPVWNADAVVAELYEPGQDGWELLRARYGERFVPDPNAGVDKKALLSAMQESKEVREEVMHLVHPLVRASLQMFFKSHARARMAVAEVPLLVESGWHSRGGFDALVGVSCPYEQRMKRLEHDRGWDRSLIESMESWQAGEQDKLAPMDLIVRNEGSLEDLAGECARVRNCLLQGRRRSLRSFFNWLKEIEVA